MAPPPPTPPTKSYFYGRGLNLAIISIVFTSVAILFVISRLVARLHIRSRLVLSDYAIILSAAFSIGLAASNCIAVEHGSGKVQDTLSPYDLEITLQSFWVCQIVYKFTINLTKTSICLLYLQIFPGVTFRRITYVVMAYVFSYAVASIVATIVQCDPIARAWNRKENPGTCIDLTAFWYANAVANILGDCIILVLPIPSTIALLIPRRQKYGLIVVFTLGAFVCVTSILRMTTLGFGSRSKDKTYATLNSTIWTTVEANTGIMCACLPMLKAPLMSIFPRIFSYTAYGTRETGPHHSHGLHNSHRLPSNAPSPCIPHIATPFSPSGGQYGHAYEDTEQGVHPHRSTSIEGKSKESSDYSKEDNCGMSEGDVPLGRIVKTINVDAKSDAIHPAPPRKVPT